MMKPGTVLKVQEMIDRIRPRLPIAFECADLMIHHYKDEGAEGLTPEQAEELMQSGLACAVRCLRFMNLSEEESGKILNLTLGLAFFHDTSPTERTEIAARLAKEKI